MKKTIRILLILTFFILMFISSGCGGATYVGVGIGVPGAWGPYGPYGGYPPVIIGRPY
jgi:hypothetical protein